MRIVRNMLLVLVLVVLPSCALVRFAGEVIVFGGKVVVTGFEITGTVLGGAVKGTVATVKFFRGERRVDLDREGNSYYVAAKINGKLKTRLLVDTGATSVQLSVTQAYALGLNLADAATVRCTLADGSTVQGWLVELEEVQVGSVEAENVRAIVLPTSEDAGLLGMSFLGNFEFGIDTEKEQLWLRSK